jgi:hypothetical protein
MNLLCNSGLKPDEERSISNKIVSKKLFLDKTEDAISTSGLVCIPRRYIQGERGELIIEAEEPTRFVIGDESDPLNGFGRDTKASADRYIAYLKQAQYAVEISKPVKLRLWYHAYFPGIGQWMHTERLDNGNELNVTDHWDKDASAPNLKQWLWKKGGVYDFSAGSHIFFLDWQGGARLDQLAFLPEGEIPKEGEVFAATYGNIADKGAVQTIPVKLRADQKLRQLSTKVDAAGGRVEMYLSADQGKNWSLIPASGDLSGFVFADEKQLLIKYILHAAENHSSPLVMPGSLTAVATSGVSPLAKVSKDILFNEKSISLTPSGWRGVRPDEAGWKFVQARLPDEKGVIWLDAAEADKTIFAPPQASWIQDDKDAFSGKAVYQGGHANFNLLSFDISMSSTVKCRPWFRIKLFKSDVRKMEDLGATSQYIPSVGYQFDRNELVTTDSRVADKDHPFGKELALLKNDAFSAAAFQKQEWVWIPGKPVSLEAGPHVFRIRKGLEYVLLDRIALVCGDNHPPVGKGADSPRVLAKEGEMVFHAVNTASVKDIALIKADGELAGCTITYSVSMDQGRTFKPLADAAQNKAGRPQNGFIIKAVIKAGENSDRLHINRFVAELGSTGQTGVELSNAEQRILFDGRSGMLTGWWTQKAGWIVPQGYAQPYFNFLMGDSVSGFSLVTQASAELVDIQTSTVNGVKTLLLKYAMVNDMVDALVQIDLPPTGLAQWSLKLINQSPRDLKSIKFPLITGIRVGNDPEKNSGVASTFYAPDFAVPGMPLLIPNNMFSKPYPGHCYMGWFSVYSDLGAFTAQVRDTDRVVTEIGLEPDANIMSSQIKFDRLLTIGPGEENESHYALGFHGGDWHQSADFYSQWAHSWMNFSYVNKNWAKDADGWVSGWHFVSGWMATRYLTHLVPEMKWLGASYLQHFSNCIDGTNSSATLFALNPKYGTLAEFRKAHAESAKQGVYHTYYTPSRIFSDLHAANDAIGTTPRELLPPEIKMFPPSFGAKWGAKNPAGSASCGYNIPTRCVNICPASQGGHEFLVDGIATNYSLLAGAQGVYSDEACGDTACYDTTHNHGKQYGLWNKGLQDSYKESLDIARKRNPDVVLACEGAPDQLLQYVDFALGYFGLLELYTFPEIKMLGPHMLPAGTREENTRFNHLYLRANRMIYTPGSRNDRQFFAHRKRIRDWMYGCKFMDDCGLTASRPGIITKWFQREDVEHSGALINIQNEFAEGATVTLRSPLVKDVKFALAYLLDEDEVIKVVCAQEKDGLKIAIPKAKASSILIPVKFPDKEAIRAYLTWPQTAGANKLVLMIANLSKHPQTLSLAYIMPKGITLKDPPASIRIDAFDVSRMEIQAAGIEAMSGMAEAKVVVNAGVASTMCSTMLRPVLYNGGFEADSSGKGTPDAWRTLGAFWHIHLIQNLSLPFDLNHADGVLDPQDPAEGKLSLRLDGKVPIPYYWGGERQYMWAKERREERLKLADTRPWCFNTGQLLLLKPGTRYQVSFKFRTAADAAVIEITSTVYGGDKSNPDLFPTQKVSPQKGNRNWQQHVFQFSTPTDRSECVLNFKNTADQPVWIDDVKVVNTDNAQ